MAHAVPNTNPSSNATFETWLTNTNEMGQLITSNVVTTAANSIGETTSGNAYMSGTLAANVVAAGILTGGNVQSTAVLDITSNVAVINSSYISVGNSSVNTIINSTAISTGTLIGNTSQATSLAFGNSTVNAVMNSVVLIITAPTTDTQVNSSIVFVGNSSVNLVANSTTLKIGAGILTSTTWNGNANTANTANNANNLGGQLPAYYSNASIVATILSEISSFITSVQSNTTVFTSNGTYSMNANLLYAEITVVGAGGSSLLSSAAGSGGGPPRASAGGSGGGTAIKKLNASVIRSSEPVIVGLAVSVSNGTSSQFGNSTSSFTELIGNGGKAPANIGNSSIMASSAVGGTATGGDINIQGGQGDSSDVPSSGSNRASGGRGGDSKMGFGGGSAAANTPSSVAGNPGAGYGGGAGGSVVGGGAGSDAAGGVASNGVVIIVEYYSV